MERHDFFDLWMHNDGELAAVLNELLPQLGLFEQWARMGIDTILASQYEPVRER